MAYSIKNWKTFQHFKDRKPPWIKLYRDILDDPEWHDLDPEAAKMLVMLWLLASETDGNLPDIKKISFRFRMTEQKCKSLIGKLNHWVYQHDINVISEGYQHDAPETETETETDKKKRASKSKGNPLPENWVPSETTVARLAQQYGFSNGDAARYVEAFRDQCKAKGYEYKDFDAAFSNCVRQDWPKFRNGAAKMPKSESKGPRW